MFADRFSEIVSKSHRRETMGGCFIRFILYAKIDL